MLESCTRIVTTEKICGISEIVKKNGFHSVFTNNYDMLNSGRSMKKGVGMY